MLSLFKKKKLFQQQNEFTTEFKSTEINKIKKLFVQVLRIHE